jgi:N-carbamoyl-L-amino-acid hydrolase
MNKRKDAAQGAAALTLAVREVTMDDFPGCFANIGVINLAPGYFNIIPEAATVALELRSANEKQFKELKKRLLQEAQISAERFGLDLEIAFLGERQPAESDPRIQQAIQNAVQDLDLTSIPIVSRAGHDAQPISGLCPMGMIFVPSVDGISHAPEELTHWDDCINGANTLLQATIQSSYLLSRR